MIKKLPNYLLLAMALLYSACKKNTTTPQDGGPPATSAVYRIALPDDADQNAQVAATFKVAETTTGSVVPEDFLGFSFEKQIMADTTYFNTSNTTFIRMFKNLNGGMMRVGGSTSDRTYWSNGKRKILNIDSVYTNDITRFKAFAQSVGWKTIWNLNLGTGSPANDADEAAYITKNMGDQIANFAIGNEPQYLYVSGLRQLSYNAYSYLNEFNTFENAVKASAPTANFSGPDNQDAGWGFTFMQGTSNPINMLTAHYYRMGPAGSPGVTMAQLLSFDQGLQVLANDIAMGAQSLQSAQGSYRITECNSVYGGGQQNMSNAYASSLWGSEFLFFLASQGVGGVNFHTGPTPNYVYSPVNTVNGKSVARPLYYAMLMFNQANIKQFTNNTVTNSTGLNIGTYSFLTRNNKRGVMIINKDLTKDLLITVKTSVTLQTANVYELNGPALTSLTGTNINGAMVDDDGNFSVAGQEFGLANKYSGVTLKVKPTSAMLVVMD